MEDVISLYEELAARLSAKAVKYRYRIAIIEHEYENLDIMYRTNSRRKLPGFLKCAEQSLLARKRRHPDIAFTLVTLESKVQ